MTDYPRHYNAAADMVDRHLAEGRGEKIAFIDPTRSMTYAELAAESNALVSLEIVETNPILDDRNITGKLAVELALSALGKTIY